MSVTRRSYKTFDAKCRRCARLADFLDRTRIAHPGYHAAPVPAFGAARPALLIVGLAPGMHGANRTGRPFTGDHAGILLYRTLYRFGFASAPHSLSGADELKLVDCRVTNAVKCLPPNNRPEPAEISACNGYLGAELRDVNPGGAILALGTIAHRAVLNAVAMKPAAHAFVHGARHLLCDGHMLFDSYHCSRYNTQTKRLTETMFEGVFDAIVHYLGRA